MIAVPLYFFLLLYLLCLTIFVIFWLVNLYHVIMTASFTLTSFFFTVFIFVATGLVLYLTWQLMAPIDWSQPVLLFNLDWFHPGRTFFRSL